MSKCCFVADAALMTRLVEALERLAPPTTSRGPIEVAEGYLWAPQEGGLLPIREVARVDLHLLQRIESQRDALLGNTRNFARGRPANNALLWGARGTGKSSLVKAVHAHVNAEGSESGNPLGLIEVQREDIATLPKLLALLKAEKLRRFILFCDDLSFDSGEAEYKSLKAVLDGGISGRPDNVIVYATSNRRHLLSRDMIENEQSTAIHASEAVEEKVSLSDRFGLWLGFYGADQAAYLEMVDGYADHLQLDIPKADLHRQALQWAMQRGSRSGRTAYQFIQDSLGHGKESDPLATHGPPPAPVALE